VRGADQRGSVAILFALALTALMGFAALVVDVGQAALTGQRLQQAAAAGALAGAVRLPQDPAGAVAAAVAVAAGNGVAPGSVSATPSPDGTSLRVTVQGSTPTTFARVFGIQRLTLGGTATAQVGLPGAVFGAVPFGVPAQTFVVGQPYVLKSGSGNVQGNFFALALGGRGAANYEWNLEHGFAGWLHVGDEVEPEPGDMAGPTATGVQYRLDADPGATVAAHGPDSPRLLLVPVVTGYGPGRSQPVTVVGFAAFFLTGQDDAGDVVGVFERAVVRGGFLPYSAADDAGVHVVRLSD
jgi:Flp pilus assembly protein TadG